eukprot:14338659-Alexandrium_andersonii.AAC.1
MQISARPNPPALAPVLLCTRRQVEQHSHPKACANCHPAKGCHDDLSLATLRATRYRATNE